MTWETWFTWIWFGVGFLIWLIDWVYYRKPLPVPELMLYLLFGNLALIFYIVNGAYKILKNKVADYYIEYEWKPSRVFLPDFHEWCKANAGIQYCGLTAGCLDMDIEETFGSTLMRSGKGKNVLRIYFVNKRFFIIFLRYLVMEK